MPECTRLMIAAACFPARRLPAKSQLQRPGQRRSLSPVAVGQVELECVVNAAFHSAMREVREFAGQRTAELKCPLMRLLQI